MQRGVVLTDRFERELQRCHEERVLRYRAGHAALSWLRDRLSGNGRVRGGES